MWEGIDREQGGIIFNLQRFSLHDGPGIRTTVFLKGCPLRCLCCANPESRSPSPQLLIRQVHCTGCGCCLSPFTGKP
jgi:pyruvate formate lyase activating enzyme